MLSTNNSQRLDPMAESTKNVSAEGTSPRAATTAHSESSIAEKNKIDPWIASQHYYHGYLPREDIPSILTKHGDFLVRSTETFYTTKSNEVRRKISPIICVMFDPDDSYTKATESERLEMIRNLMIHVKSGKTYVDPKHKFESVADMFEHHQKNTFTVNDKELILTRGIGLTNWEFQHKNVKVGKSIGRGQYGEVKRAKLTLKNGNVVNAAVKSIKTDAEISKEIIKEVMKEARLMRGLRHPNVVKLYGVGVLERPLYILLEYVAGGSLKTYLKKNKQSISIDERVQMALGAAWGIDYLHKAKILHRDIAARNCLYDHDSAVKISDFGLSRNGVVYKMKSAKKMPVRWMAPESITTYNFSQKSDVYSFGVLVYEIFSAQDPYGEVAAAVARKKIIEGETNNFPKETPKEVVDFVKEKMWHKEPDKRADMEKIVDWLEQYSGLAANQKDNVDFSTPKDPKLKSTNKSMVKTSLSNEKHRAFASLRRKNKNYERPKKTEVSQDADETRTRATVTSSRINVNK
ncbi:hypothetical protein RB195_012733 [Necator americanus]|uniref:Tyrosine-protein kinase n=1 Tax=Necator americanus TaxID=51031 RepID=A0ABR1DSB2_NECAM